MPNNIQVQGQLSLDGAGWDRTLQQSTQKIETFSGSLGGIKEAIAGAFTIGAVKTFASEMNDLAEHVSVVSREFGISAQSVLDFNFAFHRGGEELSNFQTEFALMQKNLEEAQNGGEAGEKMAAAFARLGITMQDLKTLKPEDIFKKMGEAMEGVTPSARKIADLMEVFGKNGAKLGPVLQGLKENVATSQRTGSGMGAQAMQMIHESNESAAPAGNFFKNLSAATYAGVWEILSLDFDRKIINAKVNDQMAFERGRGNALDRDLAELNAARDAKLAAADVAKAEAADRAQLALDQMAALQRAIAMPAAAEAEAKRQTGTGRHGGALGGAVSIGNFLGMNGRAIASIGEQTNLLLRESNRHLSDISNHIRGRGGFAMGGVGVPLV